MHCSDNKDDVAVALLGRARAFCAAAEQCTSNVEQKLRDWGADDDMVDGIVASLRAEGYLDDERYARAFCESKMLRSGWGRLKVIHHMRQKRLSADAVAAGLGAVDAEAYLAVMADVAAKKMAGIHDADPQVRRRKLAAFLAQRGYTMDEINEILTNIKHQL